MILSRLKHLIKGYLKPKAVVLMYHRIATPDHDVWNIAVSPQRFEEQLQVLKAGYKVVPLTDLVKSVQKKTLKRNSVAITFDDGYADNYLMAKPLLEKYNLPATFFIPTENLGKKEEFWWDELDDLILSTPHLPASFSMEIGENLVVAELADEIRLQEVHQERHKIWKAYYGEPTTARSKLFLSLWELIRPLPYHEQQAQLQRIRAWAGVKRQERTEYRTMTVQELQDLAQNRLFDIGGHTLTHAFLPAFPKEKQLQEIRENRQVLQKATGQTIETFSYPYGASNEESKWAAAEAGFKAALTTQGKAVESPSNVYEMARVQVNNLSSQEFKRWLKLFR